MNATDTAVADPATDRGGSRAGDSAASPSPAPAAVLAAGAAAPDGGQVWLGSGELARHRAILLAAGPQAALAPEPGPPRTG